MADAHLVRRRAKMSEIYNKNIVAKIPLFARLFLLSLLIPFKFYVGNTLLFPYRLLAIIAFVPVMYRWALFPVAGTRAPDILVIFHTLWVTIALFRVHGVAQSIQPAGVYFLDFAIPYLIARNYITNLGEFYKVYKLFYNIIFFLLPFVIFETITGHYLLLDILNRIYPSHQIAVWEQRMGLTRAIGVFEHPILFGVFCAFGFSITFYTLGKISSSIRIRCMRHARPEPMRFC